MCCRVREFDEIHIGLNLNLTKFEVLGRFKSERSSGVTGTLLRYRGTSLFVMSEATISFLSEASLEV